MFKVQPPSFVTPERPLSDDKAHSKPTAREVPMEVLNMGLCRTGTTSTREALLKLGYRNVNHMSTIAMGPPWEAEMWGEAFDAKFGGKGKPFGREEFDILLSRYNAVCDLPAAAFPEELMLAYPNAKLIMTVRDSPDAWTRSMSDTIYQVIQLLKSTAYDPAMLALKLVTPLGRFAIIPNKMGEYNLVGGFHQSPESNRNTYLNHNANVVQLAKKHGRELLVFNVKQGWGPLCAFLGKDIPEGEYPRVNETADMQSVFSKMKIVLAAIRTVFYGLSAAGVGWVAWVAAKRMGVQIPFVS